MPNEPRFITETIELGAWKCLLIVRCPLSSYKLNQLYAPGGLKLPQYFRVNGAILYGMPQNLTQIAFQHTMDLKEGRNSYRCIM